MSGRGYYVRYSSNRFYAENGNVPNDWFYFHMFSNTQTYITSTKWEYTPGDATTAYTFINPMDTTKTFKINTIIKWFNKDTQQAAQVLCVIDYDGYYVQDSAGTIS